MDTGTVDLFFLRDALNRSSWGSATCTRAKTGGSRAYSASNPNLRRESMSVFEHGSVVTDAISMLDLRIQGVVIHLGEVLRTRPVVPHSSACPFSSFLASTRTDSSRYTLCCAVHRCTLLTIKAG